MKVLKNNYETRAKEEIKIAPYPRKHICEYCESELEYEKSDLRMGHYGVVHIDCPICGYEIMLEDNENTITLTKDNIKYPTHFWHTKKEAGATPIDDREIEKIIKEGIYYFRNSKDKGGNFWFYGSGDAFIAMYKFEDDKNYEIIVTKDYHSTYIPFEAEDYK